MAVQVLNLHSVCNSVEAETVTLISAELLLLHYWPGFSRILAEIFVISRKSAANVDLQRNPANLDISRKIMSASRNLKKNSAGRSDLAKFTIVQR